MYLQMLWMILYFLYSQKFIVKFISRKLISQTSIILSLLYLILRGFIAYGFQVSLLLFSLAIFLFQILSLFFCTEVSQVKQQIKQHQDSHTNNQKSCRSISKGFVGVESLQQKSINLKNSPFQSKEENFINGINFILQEKQDQLNLEIKQKLRSIGIQEQREQYNDGQESNDFLYKHQEFLPQKVKINLNSSKSNCKDKDVKISIQDGNDVYSLNPFFYISLQGIAIFNSEKQLIFENQQLQFILNIFDKKVTSSETILSIKLTKDQATNQENSQSNNRNDNYDQDLNEPQKTDSKGLIQFNEYSSQIPNSFATKQTSQLYFQQNTEQTQQSNIKQDQKEQNIQLDIQIKKIENSDNNKILDDQNITSCQKSDKTFDFFNYSSNFPVVGQGGIVIGSTCDKVNELNEYQNANMISPQAKAEQSNIMSQQKFIKNKQLQQSEVQIDYSNIIEESQNNLNASYCGNKLNEIKKSQGIANQQTPNQLQGQFSNNSQQWQLNAIQKKNSFQVQECEQNISQDFFFKQRGDLKNNQELLDLIKSKSDCSIKDILSIILDPKTYHNPKKQHLGCQVNRLIELRNDKQEKGNQHGYSNYDSYDSYTPINSKLLQQQSVQKQMLCQNNKSFQHMFDIVVDDCSILIQKLIQPSNIIVTIKITILQQQSLCKEDNFENLFAFFEFTTSSQNMNQNCKQEQEKVKKIEHFAQSISWLERKLTTVLEPCIQRANLFKQYCKRGFQNFTAEEQKSIFIIPFYNSFQLIFNIIQNSRNFVQIKEDKFCLSLSSFNILNLLSKCLDIFKQQAKYQNIYLELKVQKSAKLFLCSDKLRLQQLIVNMLASSIKHTLVGKVQIQIDYIPLQQMYKISIQDTGIGIDSHACQKISQIMNLNPDELSEYENIFSNNFSFIKDHHNIDDKTDFSNAFSPYTKQQKTSSKEESSLKYIKFLMLNFIAKKLGSNNSIQLNSKKGIGTQLVFYVQDQSEIQSQINQKMHHTNESLNTQSDNQSQLQCSFEQEINMKNQQARQFRYSEKAFNHFQYQNPNQQNKEPVEQNLQILNDKRNEEHKSDFNLNSQNMQSDKDKLSQKDQSSSNKNSRFGRKSLFSDAQNLIYEESCNVQSEYNSRLSQNFSQKKTPKCEQFVVTHKIEKNYNQQDNSVETSLFQKNKIQCSIKLRKCKTQAGLENVSQSQQNQDNIVEEYDVYQFGIERNQRNINKLIDSQSENNFEENNINQQFTSFQNPNLHQKYPTSFYKCENPMQATNSDQNGSFSDFSSLLQNYFAPSKSQNAILFNNQAHKQSPRSKNNHEYSKNFEGLIKTKSPFKKAYSMRHASSEFIQSEYKSHNQKNTEAQNSFEQEDIQKYYVQDSPLFIQSQKVIKALNEDSHSQNVIKKVHTEFTQCNQTIFQGSPSSSASIQSKKTEKNSKINSKLKMCSCNQILVVEQTENSLKYIKQSLFNLKLEADCSLIGKQLLQKVKHKFQNSICCPKYKLIFIDREFSQQKASKAVQNINKIYSLIDDRIKPIFCSCEPNKNQSKQNLQDQEDETFDFCFYKKIYSDTFNDLIKLAIA